MEQFHRNNHSQSSRSSMYSTESAGNKEYRTSIDTARTSTSRPTSASTPQTRMASPLRRKPAPVKTTSPLASAARSSVPQSPVTELHSAQTVTQDAAKGLLLLVIAAKPAPGLIVHVERLLRRHALSGVTIIGRRDYEIPLKQLRLDIYGVIGRTSLDIGVQTFLRDSWNEKEAVAVLQDAVGQVNERLRAVLCVPSTEANFRDNILEISEAQMVGTWQQSFGFIHTIARATFPLLLQDGKANRLTSSFFVTQTIDQGVATMVMRSACGMLLKQLADIYRPNGVAVGYAEDNLFAEVEEKKPLSRESLPSLRVETSKEVHQDQRDSGLSESPTKLWGMWALQENLVG